MRRMLLVLFIAATAVGVGVPQPAKAVSMPCDRPMHIVGPVGLGTLGIDMTSDTTAPTAKQEGEVTVCVATWLGTRYDVSTGVLSFVNNTDGMGGTWTGVCEQRGALNECHTASVLWNGGVATTPDAAWLSLSGWLCDTEAGSLEHCFMAMSDVALDGPLGPTTGVGGGACVGESWEITTWCLGRFFWEDLRDERQRVYDILEPITIQTAR